MIIIPADAPWFVPFSPEKAALRRYKRAQRLQLFAEELVIWEERGLLSLPRLAEKIAYRRHCLAHWQAYLHGTLTVPSKVWLLRTYLSHTTHET